MGRLLLVLIELLLVAWAIFVTVRYVQLKRLLNGLHEPELWLPRRERQAHARKLLRREDDEYTQRIIEKTTQYINQEGNK